MTIITTLTRGLSISAPVLLAPMAQVSGGVLAYAADRFGAETRRLYSVLDSRLAQVEYVAGDYSIADMAIWPWASRFEHQKVDPGGYANVALRYAAMAARPAVIRGYRLPDATAKFPQFLAVGVPA